MATTYSVTGYSTSVSLGDSGTGLDVTAPFSFATSGLSTAHALALNDVIQLLKLPKGAIITDFYVYIPDLDSGTTLTLDFGLADATDGILSDSTIGRAGGVASADNAPNGLAVNAFPMAALSADNVLVLKATAASTGAGTGGTVKGWVRYNMRGQVF